MKNGKQEAKKGEKKMNQQKHPLVPAELALKGILESL